METLLLAYLIVGFIVGLIIWYASFDKEYDQYVREVWGQEPPSKAEKIVTICIAPIAWPLYLWKAFK